MKLEYTVPKAPVSFFKTLLPVLGMIIVIQLIEGFAVLLPAVMRLPLVVLLAIFFLGWTYRVVYYQMAHYHYTWIDEHWVFERVVGRSNHAVLVVKPESLVAYTSMSGYRVPRRDYFVGNIQDASNRVLTFQQANKLRSIVICLPPDMVTLLEEHLIAQQSTEAQTWQC